MKPRVILIFLAGIALMLAAIYVWLKAGPPKASSLPSLIGRQFGGQPLQPANHGRYVVWQHHNDAWIIAQGVVLLQTDEPSLRDIRFNRVAAWQHYFGHGETLPQDAIVGSLGGRDGLMDEARRLPKFPQVEGLSTRLGVPYGQALGIRACLRFMAEERYPIGHFADATAQDIANALEWGGDAALLINALVESGYLAQIESGYQMPDWVDDDPQWFSFSRWLRANNLESE